MKPATDEAGHAAPAPHQPAANPASVGHRRADAQRNIAAILDAGLACLSRSPDVNTTEIARTAGVGRVTLYGHFSTKEALVDAVVAHAITKTSQALDTLNLDHTPVPDALAQLAASSWQVLDQHRQLMVAGQRQLGPERMRAHHDHAMTRVDDLIARGQADGDIRTDLPRSWLVTTFYALLHAGADDVNAGRLDAAQAGDVIAATIAAALTAQTARD